MYRCTTDVSCTHSTLLVEARTGMLLCAPPPPANAGAAIAQHVLQCRFFRDAASVGLYITCERLREVDTMTLLRQALQSGVWGLLEGAVGARVCSSLWPQRCKRAAMCSSNHRSTSPPAAAAVPRPTPPRQASRCLCRWCRTRRPTWLCCT
jgi:hypothetical protein